MRALAYISAVIALLLLGLQGSIVLSVWFGPKENHIQLMGLPLLAPFTLIAAAATIAFANIKTKDSEHGAKDVRSVTLQRFAIAVLIVQALLFFALA